MTTPTPQFDVYLSYVRADREAVVELERRIQAMGLRVWRDETQLETGADWQAQLMEAMATVRMALFCVGATGLSEGQLRELAYASARVERDPDFVFTAALLPSAPADFPGDGAPDRARGTPVIDLRSGVAVVDRLLAFLLPTGESAGRSAESH